MAVRIPRVGAPSAPPITTAGVVGASDEVRTFTKYAAPCVVSNTHATETLYVKVNDVDASAASFHFKILAGTREDVSFGGLVDVKSVSLFYAATAAYTDVVVAGWEP